MENLPSSSLSSEKQYSKAGIILGIILVIFNISFSIIEYSNPFIRHPEGPTGSLGILIYPNVFLGFPVAIIGSYFGLFMSLFIFLSIYWFYVGIFIVWIYRKIPKEIKPLFIAIMVFVVFIVIYFSLIVLNPNIQQRQEVVPSIVNGQQLR
jgi:hypothetical protein